MNGSLLKYFAALKTREVAELLHHVNYGKIRPAYEECLVMPVNDQLFIQFRPKMESLDSSCCCSLEQIQDFAFRQ